MRSRLMYIEGKGELVGDARIGRDGRDHLYGKAERFEIDEDVADEYWRTVRSLTAPANERTHVARADRRFVPLHRR